MDVKDLLFFNKEGYQMNLNYDESRDMLNGSIFFDRNSTDTFKTQGIYLFEKVPGTNSTFQAELNRFQVFNTNGFITYPKYNAPSLLITNIQVVNLSSAYKTKWIYATDIEKYYYTGMWIYFEGLDSYHGTDFDTLVSSQINARKILAVEPGRVLVITDTTNNSALAAFTAGPSKKITPMNVIEVQQSYQVSGVSTSLPLNNVSANQNSAVDNPEPTWNETSLNSKLYADKKISLVNNSDNTGVYTIDEVVKTRFRHYTKLPPNVFTPVAGDKLNLEFELKTSRILLHNGTTTFTEAGIGNDTITVTYIPKFLKVGDTIVAQTKSVTVNALNQATLTITALDFTTNIITVNTTSLLNQTVDCYLFLATNKFIITQDILLDNNNTYSLPLTYWSIVNQYNDILNSLPGGARLEYLKDTDELLISSDYTDNFTALKVQKITGVTVTQYTIPGYVYEVTPLFVKEELVSEHHQAADSSIFSRQIIFTSIDDFGLNIIINGKRYDVDFDTTISNTTTDFIAAHQANLSLLGIDLTVSTTTTSNDTLTVASQYPNISIVMDMDMGDSSVFYIKYKDIEFNNIKSQLLITINEIDYAVPFITNDATTVANWVTAYKNLLKTFGIIVSNISNLISFNIVDPLMEFNITYNIGYIPKSGDLSVYETLYATNPQGSVISGNEIKVNTGTYNFLDFYSTGQKISISGATKLPQNKSYNVLGLKADTIHLSYQGAYWNDPSGVGYKTINIISDYFIRFPKDGLQNINNKVKLSWSWKSTQINDFFLYDFTGNQLQPWNDGFPVYSGIKPLCGDNGDVELKLIKEPNKELKYINEPTKQQTVFDIIEYELPFTDESEDLSVEPSPLQVFMGYNATYESWSKARLYLSMIEDISYDTTSSNVVGTNGGDPVTETDTLVSADELWVFQDNYVEIQNTIGLNFLQQGFKPQQIIQFTAEDINSDDKKIATLDNAGLKYVIQEVTLTRIYFTTNVKEETSVKKVSKTTLPYYDEFGNSLFEFRTLKVTITVAPKIVCYLDVYGESEQEDERFKIAINNRNLNILKLQDFFIFKQVDINEQGIDWIFMNRKRKELLEIYPEIFNNLGAYKSVIQAINFFGFNDLSFTEYFQNINPESKKFGQIFNMELLQLLDKTTQGYQYSNLAFENLRNEGYRKTNLFSLNYRITDTEGNFISSYSLDEVKTKLLGLKKWLTENILPVGTKILDINGKYQMQQNLIMKHENYMTRSFKIEEYACPVDFEATGYLQPISMGSDTYDISIKFFAAAAVDWFEYNIRTFYLEEWNGTLLYTINSYVYHVGKTYKSTASIGLNEEPGISANWLEVTMDSLPNVQILKDYQYDINLGTSFTVNKLVDPHFVVEVMWHSGYGVSHITKKTFSVIPGFFDTI